jgi:transketolase
MGHPAADLSCCDILAVLYGGVMRIDPNNPRDPERDRFICSKSHCAGALYTILAERRFFSFDELATFGKPGSRFGVTVCHAVPGVEFSTGALGHGLSIALGAAAASKLQGSQRRTFVMTGDGELQEGSNWEAILLAGNRNMAALTLIVDRNRAQRDGSTEDVNGLEPLGAKFEAFGWSHCSIDGHDIEALHKALATNRSDQGQRPFCVIANTVKGKGVSFMERVSAWHSRKLSAELYSRAVAEITGDNQI